MDIEKLSEILKDSYLGELLNGIVEIIEKKEFIEPDGKEKLDFYQITDFDFSEEYLGEMNDLEKAIYTLETQCTENDIFLMNFLQGGSDTAYFGDFKALQQEIKRNHSRLVLVTELLCMNIEKRFFDQIKSNCIAFIFEPKFKIVMITASGKQDFI